MAWEPPETLQMTDLVKISQSALARPDVEYKATEFDRSIKCATMTWDVGGMVYEPTRDDAVLRGADGKKVGIFLLHGGGGDHRQMDNLGTILVQKFGIKVLTLTYPGHNYYGNPEHSWPGEPLDDGTGRPRVPMWDRNNPISHDEYELIEYKSNPSLRAHRGTSFFLAAKPGTQFYARQAAWPLAYEKAYLESIAMTFPEDEYTVYLHGHSTGGPQAHMLLQRVPNVGGLVGMETSSFGVIKREMDPPGYGGESFPFNYMTMRSWRDTARYMGVEAGPEGMMRLPLLMEEVFESWDRSKDRPGFKSEHFIQFAGVEALTDAAEATADLIGCSDDERKALIERYLGYTKPLSGPDAAPVPPLLYIINEGSRDHRLDNYTGVLFPRLSEIQPAPKARLTYFHGGQHNYNKPTEGLSRGAATVGAQIWHDAIVNGYYLP